ncbi:hypothetical protein FisN_2Hu327 [Fistulifera solaris]|uniref:HMG box domain-containing protein n=1 Tax=Fistulifera solaris TaxID=1519565 RepID=A0A1Z5KK76_FISSO|nr:hypothetical protein FisN_2Hu327 [Fistulifera solaris]|eukprot:GAX26724.1 hypothetical protein FisN_2Hu327 [Fistulifera solaris]
MTYSMEERTTPLIALIVNIQLRELSVRSAPAATSNNKTQWKHILPNSLRPKAFELRISPLVSAAVTNMKRSAKKIDASDGDSSEERADDRLQQNHPQRGSAMPFYQVLTTPMQLNDYLFPLVNSQLVASRHHSAVNNSNAGNWLASNTAAVYSPQVASIDTALRANMVSSAPTSSYHAQSNKASRQAEESSVALIKPTERSLSRPTPVKPKRPLSAYNVFFREERAKIIEEREGLEKQDLSGNSSPNKKQRYQPNGTGFEDLAKEISRRWKAVDSKRLSECTRLAEADTERYHKELAEYNELREERLSAKQLAQVASVSEETWKNYLANAEKQKPPRKRSRKGKDNKKTDSSV